jgi:hypothetical protein
MPITDSRFDRLLTTIDAICRSPSVQHYRIGYTSRSIQARSDQYRATKWDHFVALADRLSQSEALLLEQELFEEIRDNEDRRSVVYCKYDPGCLDGPTGEAAGERLMTERMLIPSIWLGRTSPVIGDLRSAPDPVQPARECRLAHQSTNSSV